MLPGEKIKETAQDEHLVHTRTQIYTYIYRHISGGGRLGYMRHKHGRHYSLPLDIYLLVTLESNVPILQ